jgi:glycerophosphoryl diester phosphodiesterase
MAPEVPLVQLVERAQSWPVLRRVVGPGWVVAPALRELREHPKLGRKIVRAGHELHVWVVNTRADLELVQGLGATAVITDRPAHLLQLLDRQQARGGSD